MCTLLQAMMLLDSRHNGYEYSSISADETMRYASHIKNNYSEEQKEKLFDIICYLEKAFPESNKMLKKVNIPMLMLVADLAMGDGYNAAKSIYRVGPMYFRQWFSYFFDECCDEYKQYCSSGSIKKEKTLKRIELMEQSFKEYFEFEETADNGNTEGDNNSENSKESDPLKVEEPLQDVPLQGEDSQEAISQDAPPEEGVSEKCIRKELVTQEDSENVSMPAEGTSGYGESGDTSKPPDAVPTE